MWAAVNQLCLAIGLSQIAWTSQSISRDFEQSIFLTVATIVQSELIYVLYEHQDTAFSN